MTFKRIYLLPVGIIVLVLTFALVAYYRGDKPKGAILSRKENGAVQANIDKDDKEANQKRAASERAATAAEKPIADGNAAAKQAVALRTQTHQKPKFHAQTTTIADTAVQRLDSFLSTYADR